MREPETTRKPDKIGIGGAAWRLDLPARDATQEATIGQWLVHAGTYGNPEWPWYMLSVIHLREISGQPPALLTTPDAEYEFWAAAIDPSEEPYPPDPDAWPDEVRMMSPVDQLIQFRGVDDKGAEKVLEAAVDVILRGDASPDHDYREWWQVAIQESIDHLNGLHGESEGD